MRAPGCTSFASVLKSGREQRGGTGNIARRDAQRAPLLMAIGVLYLSLPVRIWAFRSCSMQMVRLALSATLRRRSIMRGVPRACREKKFSRATSMPSPHQVSQHAQSHLPAQWCHTILAFLKVDVMPFQVLVPLVTVPAFFSVASLSASWDKLARSFPLRAARSKTIYTRLTGRWQTQRAVNHRVRGIDPDIQPTALSPETRVPLPSPARQNSPPGLVLGNPW